MVVGLSVWGHSHVTSSPFRGTIRATVGAIILVAMFLLGVGEAQAQTTDPVCSNTPEAGERISCVKEAASTEDIDIEASDLTITTTISGRSGISALHDGSGTIYMDLTNPTIRSEGSQVTYGIVAKHGGTGDIDIFVYEGSVTTLGSGAHGVLGWGYNSGVEGIGGNISIDIQNLDIVTEGTEGTPPLGIVASHGIYGVREEGPGRIDISVSGGSVTTKGRQSNGIRGWLTIW